MDLDLTAEHSARRGERVTRTPAAAVSRA